MNPKQHVVGEYAVNQNQAQAEKDHLPNIPVRQWREHSNHQDAEREIDNEKRQRNGGPKQKHDQTKRRNVQKKQHRAHGLRPQERLPIVSSAKGEVHNGERTNNVMGLSPFLDRCRCDCQSYRLQTGNSVELDRSRCLSRRSKSPRASRFTSFFSVLIFQTLKCLCFSLDSE